MSANQMPSDPTATSPANNPSSKDYSPPQIGTYSDAVNIEVTRCGTEVQATVDQLRWNLESLRAEMTELRNDVRTYMQNPLRLWNACKWAQKCRDANTRAGRGSAVYFSLYKVVPGHPAVRPAHMPGDMPNAEIGSALPTSKANPLPDWTLPAYVNATISASQVQMIEYWYNESFNLPPNASDIEAARCLYDWMGGYSPPR